MFLFDLDGTITAEETLPLIADNFGRSEAITKLTRDTVSGVVPFATGFLERVRILGDLDVSEVSELLAKTRLHSRVVEFISLNSSSCAVVSGNFKGWISELASQIPCSLYSSEGHVDQAGMLRISKVLKKEDVVRHYQDLGEEVVFVGEGNNDAEAMKVADISIACGLVHEPADSVLEVADYVAYDESALVRLLNQIASPRPGTSLVLAAAGLGSRLGIGQTKGLLDFYGQTLVCHQLSLFRDLDDVRVVTGFQSKELVSEVLRHRKDVIFVQNHQFSLTGSGYSTYLGSKHANEFVLAWDADLIVHPEDVYSCLNSDFEFLGISKELSEDGVFAQLDNEQRVVEGFSRAQGKFEWSGPARIHKNKLNASTGNLFEVLEHSLPLRAMVVRARDVDTFSDYGLALERFASWFLGNKDIDDYYKVLALEITEDVQTKNKAQDSSLFDAGLVNRFASLDSDLLDLGSGTGLIVNKVAKNFKTVTAVEKQGKFAEFIQPGHNVKVVISDIMEFETTETFHVATLFGLMQFFSEIESERVYSKVIACLHPNGKMIVKHQMGRRHDVVVKGKSEELGVDYFSVYRTVEHETEILERSGFIVEEVVDIYPPEFNRWENTFFYALVCSKL
jgi:HAD superfamily phosphoserine phosphatase-like hydrolase